MTDLKPCRFCGETEHLHVNRGFSEDWAFNADNQIARDPKGAFEVQSVDFVECAICDATAPAATWNGESDWSERRANTLAAWAEHDAAVNVALDHIEANSGERVALYSVWEFGAPASEVLAAIERENGLASTGDQVCSVEGIVNSIAGRIPVPASEAPNRVLEALQ